MECQPYHFLVANPGFPRWGHATQNCIKRTRMHSSRMRYHTGGVSLGERPLDRDLPGQRHRWTETPLDRDPLHKDAPGQRPIWTETSLLDRAPPPPGTDTRGQRHPRRETPMDRDRPDKDPLDNDPPHPCGQTCENITFTNFICKW